MWVTVRSSSERRGAQTTENTYQLVLIDGWHVPASINSISDDYRRIVCIGIYYAHSLVAVVSVGTRCV